MLLIFYIFDDDFRVCLGQEIINISHRQPSSRLNLTQLTFYSHFLRLHINLYHKENNKVSFQISWINIFKHVIRCHLCITTIYSYFFFCFSKRTLLKAFTWVEVTSRKHPLRRILLHSTGPFGKQQFGITAHNGKANYCLHYLRLFIKHNITTLHLPAYTIIRMSKSKIFIQTKSHLFFWNLVWNYNHCFICAVIDANILNLMLVLWLWN